MDRQLAGPCAEQVSFHADDVADVQQLKERVILFRHRIFLYVDLKLLRALHQVDESGLSHAGQLLGAVAMYSRVSCLSLPGTGGDPPPSNRTSHSSFADFLVQMEMKRPT